MTFNFWPADEGDLLSIDTSGKACRWEAGTGRCTAQIHLDFAPGTASMFLSGSHVALERQPPPKSALTARTIELVVLDTLSMTAITSLEGFRMHRIASIDPGVTPSPPVYISDTQIPTPSIDQE
jgi:hypothetical protein